MAATVDENACTVDINKFDWMYLSSCKEQEVRAIKEEYNIGIEVTKTLSDTMIQLTISGSRVRAGLIALGGLQSSTMRGVERAEVTVPQNADLTRIDKLVSMTTDYLMQRVFITVHVIGSHAQVQDGRNRIQRCVERMKSRKVAEVLASHFREDENPPSSPEVAKTTSLTEIVNPPASAELRKTPSLQEVEEGKPPPPVITPPVSSNPRHLAEYRPKSLPVGSEQPRMIAANNSTQGKPMERVAPISTTAWGESVAPTASTTALPAKAEAKTTETLEKKESKSVSEIAVQTEDFVTLPAREEPEKENSRQEYQKNQVDLERQHFMASLQSVESEPVDGTRGKGASDTTDSNTGEDRNPGEVRDTGEDAATWEEVGYASVKDDNKEIIRSRSRTGSNYEDDGSAHDTEADTDKLRTEPEEIYAVVNKPKSSRNASREADVRTFEEWKVKKEDIQRRLEAALSRENNQQRQQTQQRKQRENNQQRQQTQQRKQSRRGGSTMRTEAEVHKPVDTTDTVFSAPSWLKDEGEADLPPPDYHLEPVAPLVYIPRTNIHEAFRWSFGDVIIYVMQCDITSLDMHAVINTVTLTSSPGSKRCDIEHCLPYKDMRQYNRKLSDLNMAETCVTKAEGLPFDYIVHVIKPQAAGYSHYGKFETALYQAYFNALWEVEDMKIPSVAFPIADNLEAPRGVIVTALLRAVQVFLKGSRHLRTLAIVGPDPSVLADIIAGLEDQAHGGLVHVNIE